MQSGQGSSEPVHGQGSLPWTHLSLTVKARYSWRQSEQKRWKHGGPTHVTDPRAGFSASRQMGHRAVPDMGGGEAGHVKQTRGSGPELLSNPVRGTRVGG
jgi:hypothetical protein